MSRAYRVISPNIHEYISYITWIPKYAKDVITRDPAFFVHKTKNGDRGGGPTEGRESLQRKKESCVYIHIYIYSRTTKKICHVMRRGLWNEDDQNAVNRRRGGKKRGKKRQRQMQESRKRSSCTPCTQLSLSLSLYLSLFPTALLTLAFRFYAFISLSRLRIFLPPLFTTRKRYALRNISIRVHWERGEIFLSLERLRETLNFECACCEIVRGKF